MLPYSFGLICTSGSDGLSNKNTSSHCVNCSNCKVANINYGQFFLNFLRIFPNPNVQNTQLSKKEQTLFKIVFFFLQIFKENFDSATIFWIMFLNTSVSVGSRILANRNTKILKLNLALSHKLNSE